MPVFRSSKIGSPRDFANACFLDDDFFKMCFQNNVEAAQVLVDRILGIPGLKVISAKTQQRISSFRYKDVVLDLSAETASGDRVDIEVQKARSKNLPKRARYYVSAMTTRMLRHGSDYGKLKDAYVLFICENDPFKQGKPLYSFAMQNKEMEEPRWLNDGAAICFFNCAYEGDDAFGRLAADMKTGDWRSINDPVLKTLSRNGKLNAGDASMSYSGLTDYEKGERAGRKEGRFAATKKTREEDVAALLRQGIISPEQIAEAFNMPLDEVLKIKKKIKA